MAKKQMDDLVDAGSEYSFPASDPPSYMGGTAVAGGPPESGEPPHEHVVRELTDPDEAKPAEDPAQGTEPGRSGAPESPPPEMPSARSSASADTAEPPDSDTDARVRLRAYQIWESEGRSGDAEEDWLRAERDMRGASHRQEAHDNSRPPSEEAEKMVEQVKVAMDARNARSKQTKRTGATGKKETSNTGSKTTAPRSRKGEPRGPK